MPTPAFFFAPPRRGRACPARALFHNHPLIFRIVGRGLDPSACPFPAGTRSPFRHPVGAGHARPATSPPPAVNLPPPTHSPKPPDPATRLPPTTPHNLCPPTAVTPIYTLPKLHPQTLSKKSKNLKKPVDKGHTTCYNNQAVSRAQPAAAAAGAFTYSLYAVF